MRIAIVTDSTAYLNKEEYEQDNIYFVPLSVIFKNEVFKEEVDITSDAFFEKVRESEQLPTSSQPTVGDLTALYQELEKDYDAVISIHLSSRISGTFQNAYSVVQTMDNINVYPYDSEMAAAGQAYLVRAAAKLAKEGHSVNEIIEQLDKIKQETKIYFIVDDLTNLIKGGRLSRAAGGVATALKIKPVLTFRGGEIIAYDKIRTKKKALKKIESLLAESVKEKDYPLVATVVHAYAEDEAQAFKEQMEDKFPDVRFISSFLGPVVGVHTGEGAVGMSWTIDIERL
ncbi:EDD domain protein, DegV family [Alkalibacterium subtropicum]|uniref:EDD domain protein, DegV family n=1 Tax=Alkalibacterium subtropicum TaxID=753702 RepID=A0A1I1HZ20_9LACT|nr:DegV family protein [Alkalibacterium subtropicum]SFC29126.1 EDD domain protein, DegV family [Alkalibacterium subtropicum]